MEDCCEIEILQERDYSDLHALKYAEYKTLTKRVATVVINGVPQQYQEVSQVILACPNCEESLVTFQEGLSVSEINSYIVNNAVSDNVKTTVICSHCGQLVSLLKEVVSEQ